VERGRTRGGRVTVTAVTIARRNVQAVHGDVEHVLRRRPCAKRARLRHRHRRVQPHDRVRQQVPVQLPDSSRRVPAASRRAPGGGGRWRAAWTTTAWYPVKIFVSENLQNATEADKKVCVSIHSFRRGRTPTVASPQRRPTFVWFLHCCRRPTFECFVQFCTAIQNKLKKRRNFWVIRR